MELQCTVVFEKNWNAIHELNSDGSRRYRYIINKGSSRSSKTISLIDCYDLYARAYNNKRLTVWRDTKTDCKKTVLNDTLKRLKTTNRYKINQEFNKTESIFTYDTDSTFEVHGTDDEETVHGLTQDASWLNEPYKISKDTFDQIDQRTSDFVFIDLNPKRDHWSEDLEKDPRTLVIHSTFKDNPFCPTEQRIKILGYQPIKRSFAVESKMINEQEVYSYNFATNLLNIPENRLKELYRCLLNEEKKSASITKWDIYGLGIKAERPNRIFNWKTISYSEYLKIQTKTYIGVDWGKVDSFGILEAKYYDGKLFLHELNYDSENKWQDKLSVLERQNIQGVNEGFVTWLFRKLNISQNDDIICDYNRPLKIRALRNAGWERAIEALKPKGSILDGIDLLDNLEVFYTDCSENIAYEQENYSRIVDKYGVVQEEAEDKDNHLMDPARYIVLWLEKLGIIKKV
jgi:PBSX family phage terminase large subunit